jgi:nicotinate (nicotinamide) nucleotide adenylyltransferase
MYTWELLQSAKEEFPECDFLFCMGTDLLKSFRTWEYGERLAEEINFIILNRPEYEPEEKYFPKNYRFLEISIDVSSTKIRNRIASQIEKTNKLNLGISGLTTTSVINYIIENELYSVDKK